MKHDNSELIALLDQPFRVGNWLVEPSLNRLTDINQASVKQTIEPRLMHLLCFVAANPERVLTRDQLTNELWPCVIVNENSLTRAVSELRKKLSVGNKSGQQFLQTISKSGYRLIAEVRPHSIPDKPRQNKLIARPIPGAGSALAWMKPGAWQAVIGSMSLILAIVISTNQTSPFDGTLRFEPSIDLIADQVIDPQPQYEGAVVRFSANNSQAPGFPAFDNQTPVISSPLVSEDGGTLAYIRNENNLSTIYLSGVESVESPMPVFSSENRLFNLSWSPLGNALLFASEPLTIAKTLMDEDVNHARLMMLDLESLRVSVLLDPNPGSPDTNRGQSINLT
jgi:DNA-binding winged helix-turn-helix (wHTH) protein